MYVEYNAGRAIAILVTIALLLNAIVPTLAHAAIYLQGAEVNANTLVQDAYVQVVYRDRNDEQKLTEGWIDTIGETSFTIRSGALFGKKTIGYDKVLSLIMSDESTVPAKQMNEVNRFIREMKAREIKQSEKEDRTDQPWYIKKAVTVMSHGQIDPSEFTIGWYAHVVYISKEGTTRTATGQIVNKYTTLIFVKDRIDRMTTSTIAYDDIDTLVVAKQWQDIERYRESGVQYNAKVRFNASLVSERRMVGRLVKVTQDTLVIQRGRRFYEVPLSSISNLDLEVSIGQYRNTGKGMLFGAGLGTTIYVATSLTVEETPEGEFLDTKGLAEFFGLMAGLLVCLSSTLIGYKIKSDKWVEVSPHSLNLSVAPLSAVTGTAQAGTSTKGLRAALTFNF